MRIHQLLAAVRGVLVKHRVALLVTAALGVKWLLHHLPGKYAAGGAMIANGMSLLLASRADAAMAELLQAWRDAWPPKPVTPSPPPPPAKPHNTRHQRRKPK